MFLRFILDYFVLMLIVFVVFGLFFFGTVPTDWLERTSPKWPILCWVGCETWTQILNISTQNKKEVNQAGTA